ncbi:MAG: hypothetical protein JSS12_08710 [Verrucomicrobia bacterium]|nr:hypothetical protein [Verrucomicrobiota bacterium]
MNYLSSYLLILFFSSNILAAETDAQSQLQQVYERHCNSPSDINEHIPVLRALARECSSVTEIGIREMVSTWGILLGLSESNSLERCYTGIDLVHPPQHKFDQAKSITQSLGISFQFVQGNDMVIDIRPCDMLFIDSLHTYCHLTYELEAFSPRVGKFIAMHDTSAPWGDRDDTDYHGNYSEYSSEIDRNKRGLWPAVEDFLAKHPEWRLRERRFNNHGFTVLERVKE